MSESTVKNNAVRYELVAEAVHDPGSTDPLVLLRKTLRGRYALALVLAVALGALGASAGYQAVPPVYESTGLVRIAPSMPAVLYEETSEQFAEPFETFAEAQETQLSSRPVLRDAANSPELVKLGWPAGDEGVHALEDALRVSRERGQQFIYVSAQHHDPLVAQTAVNAVLTTYRKQSGDQNALSPDDVEQLLQQREQKLQGELQALREDLLAASGQYGADVIDQMHASKVEQLLAIDQKLAQIDRAVQSLTDNIDQGNDAEQRQAVQTALAQLTAEDMQSAGGMQISALRQREQTLKAEIETWSRRYSPEHPMIRELKRQLEVVQLRLQMQSGPGLLTAAADGTDGSTAQATISHLLDVEQAYVDMRETVSAEAEDLGRRRAAIAGINEHVATVKQRLSETRQRLDALQVEASRPSASRVQVASLADLPLAPVKDRRKGLAAAAGMFGGLCGVGIAFLLGLVDRRCRYVDQLAQCIGNLPIVARLPDVSSASDEDLSRSALAVHNLRQMLQVGSGSDGRKIIAVTSPGAGEGKTSLTLAMAASFAGSGSRTLVIDADPGNGALSQELGMDRLAGLHDAIESGGESGEIRRTGTDNLWVLPAGSSPRATDALSHQHLKWIIGAVSDRFDVILLDTGAVTSSIEANAACAVSDYVVLITVRNQNLELVKEAADRVKRSGSPEIGVVFNRAVSDDVRRETTGRTAAASGIAPLVPGVIPAQAPTAGRIERQDVRAAERREQAA